jgi:hypothetical protein
MEAGTLLRKPFATASTPSAQPTAFLPIAVRLLHELFAAERLGAPTT